MGRTYGYVFILPYEQDKESQIITLREMHIAEKNIFIDVQGECNGVSTGFQKLLKRLKADDLLYIKSLDTLGSSHEEIGKRWRTLTKEKKADIVVLDMPQVDTRRGKAQFHTLIADLVLTMLEYVPSIENQNRKQKQREGIKDAKRRGVQFGRPHTPLPDNFEQIYQAWSRKEVNGEQAAELCGMSRSSFYKKAHERKVLES